MTYDRSPVTGEIIEFYRELMGTHNYDSRTRQDILQFAYAVHRQACCECEDLSRDNHECIRLIKLRRVLSTQML